MTTFRHSPYQSASVNGRSIEVNQSESNVTPAVGNTGPFRTAETPVDVCVIRQNGDENRADSGRNDSVADEGAWQVFANIDGKLLHEDDFDSADDAYDFFADMIRNDLTPVVFHVAGSVKRDVTADLRDELVRIIQERGLAPEFDNFGARCDYRRAFAAE